MTDNADLDEQQLLDTIMSDVDLCFESQRQMRASEEMRLRESTDPSEHLCGPDCPHLNSIESQRETIHRVCPISNLTWGSDTKWDALLAGRCTDNSTSCYGYHKRPNDLVIVPEEQQAAIIPLAAQHFTSSTSSTNTEHQRATPHSHRDDNLLETHYALRSAAEQNIYTTLESLKPQRRNISQIQQELIASHEQNRKYNMRPFTLVQLNDIQIEAQRRASQSEQRMLLHKHFIQKSLLLKQFVNLLAQLFSTLWIIIQHNQIRRREIDSFKTFVQSLLNCLHRGMRVSNQPILPRGILFFHDTKRKHRSDSAHHALQQVQQKIANLDSSDKTEHFQQCIRLSRQLEIIHEKLTKSCPLRP